MRRKLPKTEGGGGTHCGDVRGASRAPPLSYLVILTVVNDKNERDIDSKVQPTTEGRHN